jgi:hypothetical protein
VTIGEWRARTTIPKIITSSETTWPKIAAGLLASFSSSHSQARKIEMIGSHAVMIDSTGASSVPDWNAFCSSRKPAGAITARA